METRYREHVIKMDPVLRVDGHRVAYVRFEPYRPFPDGLWPVHDLEERMNLAAHVVARLYPFPVGFRFGEEAGASEAKLLRVVVEAEGVSARSVYVEFEVGEPDLAERMEAFLDQGFSCVLVGAERDLEAALALPSTVLRFFGPGILRLDPGFLQELVAPFGATEVGSAIELNELRRLGITHYAGPLARQRFAAD